MKELHTQGKTIQDIEEVLKRVPIHPRIVPAIKSAYALGYVSHNFSFVFRLFSLNLHNINQRFKLIECVLIYSGVI